jgi:hypothetical protein
MWARKAPVPQGPELPFQPVAVYVKEQKVADPQVAEDAEFSAAIPQEITRRCGLLTITLKIPKTNSPKALGLSADPRVVGVGCFDVQLVFAHQITCSGTSVLSRSPR